MAVATPADFMGAFTVTMQGIEPHIEAFAKNMDDYNKIMLQVLADRLVEAFAGTAACPRAEGILGLCYGRAFKQ